VIAIIVFKAKPHAARAGPASKPLAKSLAAWFSRRRVGLYRGIFRLARPGAMKRKGIGRSGSGLRFHVAGYSPREFFARFPIKRDFLGEFFAFWNWGEFLIVSGSARSAAPQVYREKFRGLISQDCVLVVAFFSTQSSTHAAVPASAGARGVGKRRLTFYLGPNGKPCLARFAFYLKWCVGMSIVVLVTDMQLRVAEFSAPDFANRCARGVSGISSIHGD